jgi:hypothetical protein
MGNLQPLTLPDTLDPLVVDYPAHLAQELGDLAIAIAAALPGKLDNIPGMALRLSAAGAPSTAVPAGAGLSRGHADSAINFVLDRSHLGARLRADR